MSQHPRAGQPAQPSDLVDLDALLRAYAEIHPDPSDPAQRVAFGTSGHRGSAFKAAFNEDHILATTEAICRYRASKGYTGTAVHRPRHARAVGAGLADRARGPRRPRRGRACRRARRVHAHARGVPRDPRREPGLRAGQAGSPTASSSRRRTTRPRTAASSTTRPTAARPTPTSRAGSRTRPTGSWKGRAPTGSAASSASRSSGRGRPRRATTSATRTSTRSSSPSTSRSSPGPGCGSAWTRWAARRSTTGRRSGSGTGST